MIQSIMKGIETNLESLDNYFENKKPTEFYIIVVFIVAFFGYLSYGWLIPMTEKMLKEDLKKKASLESRIRDYESFLKSVTVNGDREYKIKILSRQIGKLKTDLNNLKELNDYFDYQMQSLSEILFNEKNWSKFLDNIAKEAKENHLDILKLTNRFVDIQKNFGHVLEISIQCKGKYKNLIAFMNAIEESDLVVDIYNIQMVSGPTIRADLNVSVWGIKY